MFLILETDSLINNFYFVAVVIQFPLFPLVPGAQVKPSQQSNRVLVAAV